MSPPNPLIEKDVNYITEVKTAYGLNFKKLPDFVSNFTPKQVPKPTKSVKEFKEETIYPSSK